MICVRFRSGVNESGVLFWRDFQVLPVLRSAQEAEDVEDAAAGRASPVH